MSHLNVHFSLPLYAICIVIGQLFNAIASSINQYIKPQTHIFSIQFISFKVSIFLFFGSVKYQSINKVCVAFMIISRNMIKYANT